MDVNKILTADILDILFEGKNKAYGAYDLRRTYEKRIKIALAGTFALCLLLFVASFVANSSSKSKAQIIVEDVNLENVKEEKKARTTATATTTKTRASKNRNGKIHPSKNCEG